MPQAAKVHRAKARAGGVQRAAKAKGPRPYDKRAWRDRIRPLQLSRHPYCAHCERDGKIVLATDVDHVDGDNTNNDSANLQSLCHAHHSSKTVKYNGGFGNAVR